MANVERIVSAVKQQEKYYRLSGKRYVIEAEADSLGILHEPFPNEHAARLQDPGKYDKYRRTKGGKLYGDRITVPATVSVIWGHPKGKPPKMWVPQALRFPIKSWTVAGAKTWLKKNKIKYTRFEAAKKSVTASFQSLRLTAKLRQFAEINKILKLAKTSKVLKRVKKEC